MEHLQAGTINLFDAAVHDFLCLNAQSRVGTGSAIPPGIWDGSAKKIWLLTGRRDEERKIQRSLEKLESIGWISRFHNQGKRGDYPILIAKFVVSDLSGNDFNVNAGATKDWRHPTLEPSGHRGTDASLMRRRPGNDASLLLQDIEKMKSENKPLTLDQVLPANSFNAFWDAYPRKSAKQDAIKAWQKVKQEEVPAILAGIHSWTKTEQWAKDGGQYIPYPATFLNKRRWEDEISIFGAANQIGLRNPKLAGAVVPPPGKYANRKADAIVN